MRQTVIIVRSVRNAIAVLLTDVAVILAIPTHVFFSSLVYIFFIRTGFCRKKNDMYDTFSHILHNAAICSGDLFQNRVAILAQHKCVKMSMSK